MYYCYVLSTAADTVHAFTVPTMHMLHCLHGNTCGADASNQAALHNVSVGIGSLWVNISSSTNGSVGMQLFISQYQFP